MTSGDRPPWLDPKQNGAIRRRRRTGGEGHGWTSQIPYLLVCAGVLGGLITAWFAFRPGSFVIAVSMVSGGLFRAFLKEGRLGFLASRKRVTDVTVMIGLGLSLAFIAWQTG